MHVLEVADFGGTMLLQGHQNSESEPELCAG